MCSRQASVDAQREAHGLVPLSPPVPRSAWTGGVLQIAIGLVIGGESQVESACTSVDLLTHIFYFMANVDISY